MINAITTKTKEVTYPIWVSVSEAASLGGVQGKTIRRAIKTDPNLQYKIVKNRYQIDFASLLIFLNKNTKLKNKLRDFGLGQYVAEWK
ncbi:MAG: hypothetical protein WC249_01640 [Patescibacteria group bacterium]|jgi:hypothetical protein